MTDPILDTAAEAKPLSQILTDLENSARQLDIHISVCLQNNDMRGYSDINAIQCVVLAAIRAFTRNTEERIEQ